MPQSEPSGPGAITLDELIALNDEIAALVRAGVPLEKGLAALGSDMPGRLGKLTTAVAENMSRGQSLSQALADRSGGVPGVYRAVVTAGIRTGRLSSALEALAGSVRRLAETRRAIVAASLYPLLVFLLAWALFVAFVIVIVPGLEQLFRQIDPPGSTVLGQVGRWGGSVAYWGPAVPLVVVSLVVIWWYQSGRAGLVEPRLSSLLLGWLPWMGKMLRWARTATFAEVLALLVESRVPLDQAVVLAADGSGDRRIRRAAGELSAALARGETPDGRSAGRAGFPPLLVWLMSAGQRQGVLKEALRHAAEIYHRRSRRHADLARLVIPVAMTLIIGGGATLAFVLLVFGPWTSLLKTLAGV